MAAALSCTAPRVIDQIQRLVQQILEDISAQRDPAVRQLSSSAFCDPDSHRESAHSGAKALASILRVLRTSYELLVSGRTCTSREVYYLHAEYFCNQQEANAAVTAACSRLGLARHELGILAAPRGWIMGPIDISCAVGITPHDDAAPRPFSDFEHLGPRSVPPAAVFQDLQIVNHGCEFILVVEKECIFRRLVEDGFWRGRLGGPGPCALVTGCGFPDLATRALLWQLHRALPSLPIFGLSDWK
jgi:meiotic recombination protein SPO11